MFHVPEENRLIDHPILKSDSSFGNNGAFYIQSPEPGWMLACIVSDDLGWEHVSVHAFRFANKQQRVPSWREMCYIKDIFWDGEDTVVQYHPRKSEYVNNHYYTLHLWRNTKVRFPEPNSLLVGVK